MRQSGAWIEFNGVRSDQLGVKVLRLPDRPRSVMGGAGVSVPGRSGRLFVPDGSYEDVKLVVALQVPEGKQTTVSSWLDGGGLLRCSDRPGEAHRARVCTRYDYQRIIPESGIANCMVSFEAAPFVYAHPAVRQTIAGGGAMIDNPHSIAAEPTITIAGTGEITLMVGNKTLLLSNIQGGVTIDCENKTAYHGDVLLTKRVSGDWPTIPPGGCMLSYTGNVTSVVVEPNLRFL